MKGPDLDKERSEKRISIAEFLRSYNKDLPPQFPHASLASLKTFRAAYPVLFKNDPEGWSLGMHRKKVMDWLTQYSQTL